MLTKEQILSSYMTDEHVSPIIQDYINTTPRREITDTEHKPSAAIQRYLEQEETMNPIIKEFM